MPFKHDMTDISEGSASRCAPEGVYVLQVKEAKEARSKEGQDQVKMKVYVAEGVYKGSWAFHTVTFKAPDEKGAGFSKKFLKALGLPHEGKVTVDASKWEGKTFLGHLEVIQNEKNGKTYDNNSLIPWEVWNLNDPEAPDQGPVNMVGESTRTAKEDLQEVPF